MEDNVKDLNGIEVNYLEQIKELKSKLETMVPGDEYNKVLDEHKRLTSELVNKRQPIQQTEPILSSKEIADKIKKSKTKLDNVKLSLEYREAYKKEFGQDPWVSSLCTAAEANEVASIYENLLENYGDDPAEFTYRFDSLLSEDPQLVSAYRAKKKAR